MKKEILYLIIPWVMSLIFNGIILIYFKNLMGIWLSGWMIGNCFMGTIAIFLIKITLEKNKNGRE